MNKFKDFFISIIIPLGLGFLLSFIIRPNLDSYDALVKPFFIPDYIFPIIWSILYILMGVSFGILKSNNLLDKRLIFIYYLQLIVNLIWPIFYFVLGYRLFSFIWIILLISLVIVMIKLFYDKNNVAGLINIPYLLWLIFAAYLNLTIYLLNK